MAGVRDELPDPRLALLPRVQGAEPTCPSIRLSAAPTCPTSVRASASDAGHPLVQRHLAACRGSSETRVAVAATRRSGRRATPTIAAPAIAGRDQPGDRDARLDDDQAADSSDVAGGQADHEAAVALEDSTR